MTRNFLKKNTHPTFGVGELFHAIPRSSMREKQTAASAFPVIRNSGRRFQVCGAAFNSPRILATSSAVSGL